jgi:Tfp pilus assembly protein PilX
MVMVLLVSVLGVGLLRLGEQNHTEAARRVSAMQAFWAAEAGLAEAEARAWKNKERKDGTPALVDAASWSGQTAGGAYTVTVTGLPDQPPAYRVVSRARSPGGVPAVVHAEVGQGGALSMGLFGHTELLVNGSGAYRIRSSSWPAGQASIGSNTRIAATGHPDLDGVIKRGAQDRRELAPATNTVPELEDVYVGFIDPDPLGIRIAESSLQGDLQAARDAAADAGLPTVYRFAANTNLGAGAYYAVEVEVLSDVEVTVETGVTLYLEGPFRMGARAVLDLPEGDPLAFRVFSAGDGSLTLRCARDFTGLVYAPYARVEIEAGGNDDLRGLAWADELAVTVTGSGNVELDEALQGHQAFDAYRLETRSWGVGEP